VDEEKKAQIVSELIVTALVLLMYWISMTPEWKLEMYLRQIRQLIAQKLQRVHDDGPALKHRAILEKFRREISEYEHEERRKNAG